MKEDFFDDFLEFDFFMGADEITCPICGSIFSCS